MEATVLSLAKAVLDVALSTAKSAVAAEVALQLGVERELSFISDEFEMMKTFLMSADKEEERIHHGMVVKTWVKQVKDLAYDAEDCLQDFTLHSEKPPPSPSCCGFSTDTLVARRRIAADLRKLKSRVEDVSQRNLRYRHVNCPGSADQLEREQPRAVCDTAMFGIHEARPSGSGKQDRQVVNVDLGQLVTNGDRDLRVLSVWGTNGDLGKTTIIREAYDDPQVYTKFECRGWVKPARPFSPDQFFRTLLRQICKGFVALRKLHAMADSQLVDEFESHVSNRSYLIVINDILSIEEWDWIKTYLPDKKNGSRVIVSTQQLELASLCTEQPNQVSRLKQLSPNQALYLFYKKVSGPIRLQTAQVKLGPNGSRSNATDHIVPQDDDDDISAAISISKSRLLKHKFELAVGKPLTLSWTMAADVSNEAQLIGRDREKREITQMITSDGEHRQVISVSGMGGLGKTTLVRSVYQSQDLNGVFHKHAWVTVMHPFNSKEIFRSLVLQLHADYSEKQETDVFSMLGGGTQKNLAIMGTEELIQESIRLLKGHKYLIVLDDMLSIAECDLILPFLPEEKNASRIIVTTREAIVAQHHSREYKLRPLEDQAAVDLFKNKVFKDQAKTFHLNPDMIKEGKLIIKKCGGLPLAIATIGSFLSTKPKSPLEWRSLNDHISAELANNPSFEKIRSNLASSYEGLPYQVKPCFLYLSIFPEGRGIRRGRLVRRWIAEGYSREMRGLTADEVGDKQFTDLINRCMIQLSSTVTSASGNKIDLYQVNNLMREISVSKSEEENFVLVLEENCIMNSRDKIRHLVVSSSWSRENRNALESMMDVSHTRSLTVFGEWRSFLLSNKMRLLRVLDLEGTSGLQDHDLVPIGKLRHLKYLSLRGTAGVFNLPGSVGNLCNLETLDIRDTFVIKLPANIVKLEKLKYLRAGLIPDDETDSSAEVAEFFRKCRSVMHIRNGSNDEADNTFVSSFGQLLGVVFDLVVRGLDPYGVKVPKGIGKLKALQTLGVVNVARGNAMPRELKKLTQLRKLGVSGINKKNCKDVCSAIADHGHLLSLSMRAEGEQGLEGCLDDLSTPPSNLQRLKLYGNLVRLPSWIEQLQNLAKLTLRSTKLELDFTLQVLGKLPHLAILRLREKSCNVGELAFHFHREAFTSLTVLELENLCYLKSVKFEEAATPKLELLQIHRCRHLDNFGLPGLHSLQSLREVSFQGPCNSTLKSDLQQQLAKNRNNPSLKIQD